MMAPSCYKNKKTCKNSCYHSQGERMVFWVNSMQMKTAFGKQKNPNERREWTSDFTFLGFIRNKL